MLSQAALESCAESALPYFVKSNLTFASTAASSRQFRAESVPRNFARSSAIRIAAKKCTQAEKWQPRLFDFLSVFRHLSDGAFVVNKAAAGCVSRAARKRYWLPARGDTRVFVPMSAGKSPKEPKHEFEDRRDATSTLHAQRNADFLANTR
jgi:hypothetical protein